MPLPDFVERIAESTEPQPYIVTGGKFVCFALSAKRAAVQAVVDRYFNIPSGGEAEYRVLADYVIAGLLHIADSRSGSREDQDDQAFYVESDLLFFVPVAYGKTVNGTFRSERVVWFVPLVFVDTAAAVAEGREVYGFPKLLARCDMPRVAGDPAYFAVHTGVYQGVPVARQLREATIFEAIRHDAATFGEREETWTSGLDAITGMLDLLRINSNPGGGLGAIWEGAREKLEMLSPDQRLLVLKQFRDARDGTKACLLQIVECPIRVTGFAGAGLLKGDWTVTLPTFETLDIARDLGIVSNGGPITPLAAYWTEIDCVMENGIVVWSAGG